MFRHRLNTLSRVHHARRILALLAVVAACNPNHLDKRAAADSPMGPAAELTGRAVFWTRSRQRFPVTIFIDGERAGELAAGGPAPAPECTDTDALVVTLEQGAHVFSAAGLTDAVASGALTVAANRCTAVEIVLRDGR